MLCCAVLGKPGPQASSLHTCSVTAHAYSGQDGSQENVVGLIKNAFCASCSSRSNAHVAVE